MFGWLVRFLTPSSTTRLYRLFVCLFGFLTSLSTTRLYRGRVPRQGRLTILRAATHETELGDHDFCLSRSHYTDTDPTCREWAATAGIEPGTSSPGVARSTAELPRPPTISQTGSKTERLTIRQSWETMTSVSAGHVIMTPIQPVGSGRPQRESNPGPPHQEPLALPTEPPI